MVYGTRSKGDFTDKPDGYRVLPEDFEEYFKKINYKLKEGDIVFVHTGGVTLGSAEYLVKGCGMSKEATLWLTNQGIKVVVQTPGVGIIPSLFIGKEF